MTAHSRESSLAVVTTADSKGSKEHVLERVELGPIRHVEGLARALAKQRPKGYIDPVGCFGAQSRGFDTRARRCCATPTGSAGHGGATANLKLTFHPDHSAGLFTVETVPRAPPALETPNPIVECRCGTCDAALMRRDHRCRGGKSWETPRSITTGKRYSMGDHPPRTLPQPSNMKPCHATRPSASQTAFFLKSSARSQSQVTMRSFTASCRMAGSEGLKSFIGRRLEGGIMSV
jgi:hypothetical protein